MTDLQETQKTQEANETAAESENPEVSEVSEKESKKKIGRPKKTVFSEMERSFKEDLSPVEESPAVLRAQKKAETAKKLADAAAKRLADSVKKEESKREQGWNSLNNLGFSSWASLVKEISRTPANGTFMIEVFRELQQKEDAGLSSWKEAFVALCNSLDKKLPEDFWK